jgi:hypothetical protein
MTAGRLTPEPLVTVIQQSSVRQVHLGSAVSSPFDRENRAGPAAAWERSWNRTEAQLVAAVVARANAPAGPT